MIMVAVHLAAEVVVGALMLPFFGPALGYPYPERQPGQTYILLLSVAPVHNDPDETPSHSHSSHDADALDSDASRGDPPPDGVSLLLPFPGPSLDLHSHSQHEDDPPAIVALPLDAPPGNVPAPFPLSGSLLGYYHHPLHNMEGTTAGVLPCGPPAGYMVYLPFHNRSLKSFRDLGRPVVQVSLVFPGPTDGRFASGVPANDTLLQDAFIASPWRPPRA